MAFPSCLLRPRRLLRLYHLRLQRQPGTAHSLALGLAIGVFAGCLPFFPGIPVHTAVAVPLAMLLGANRLAAFLATNIDNPANMAFFWWAQFQIGSWLLPWDVRLDADSMDHGQLVAQGGRGLVLMFAGGALLGLALGAATYAASLPIIGLARNRRRDRLHRRRQELERAAPSGRDA